MASAAVAPFRAAGIDVSFVTKSAFAPILRAVPGISQVYEFDRSGGEAKATEQLFAWIDSQKFAGFLDLHDSLRTWTWRSRLKNRGLLIVCKKQRWREIAILVLRLGFMFGWSQGGRAKMFRASALRLLHALQIQLPEENAALTQLEIDAPITINSKVIVFFPGSAWEGKKWPAQYFIELGKLASQKYKIKVLGGPEDLFCKNIADQIPGAEVFLGLSIPDAMKAIRSANLVVGNDTGMIHIAEALGTKVLVLEGPTDPTLGFSVYRESSRILALDLACRPCSKTGSICWRWGSRECLRGLKPESVFAAVEEIMEAH